LKTQHESIPIEWLRQNMLRPCELRAGGTCTCAAIRERPNVPLDE
jgi:hypothetical protein